MGDYDWIIGFGIMLSLTFLLTWKINRGNYFVFFGFLLVFNGFIVWAGLLELWSLTITLFICTSVYYLKFRKGDVLVGLPLSFLLVLVLFNLLVGNSFIGVEVATDSSKIPADMQPYFAQYLDALGLSTTGGQTFSISQTEGALVILTTIIVISGLIGIQVLGSGISESSHRIMMICLLYGGMWGILSILVMSMITSILIIGTILYIFLTIMFVVGVIRKIGEK